MIIPVTTPKFGHLRPSTLRKVAADYYASTLAASSPVVFQLSYLQRFELHEIACLLAWSSRLIADQKRVIWCLGTTQASDEGLVQQSRRSDLRPHQTRVFQEIRDRFSRVDQRLVDAIDTGLSPHWNEAYGWLREAKRELEAKLPDHGVLITDTANWLRDRWRGYRVQGFLFRTEVLGWAERIGVVFDPPRFALTLWFWGEKPGTGTLGFQDIRQESDVDSLRRNLRDPTELAEVFEEYSSLDAIRGGALADIIVAELGRNIAEHARGLLGLLGTRILKRGDMRGITPGSLGVWETDVLEVVVCDDGAGIPATLADTLRRKSDKSPSLRERYPPQDGRFTDEQILEYALERLSSSKRTDRELITGRIGGGGERVSSGLHWVWNVVRAAKGAMGIRSGACQLVFDFRAGDSPTVHPEPFPLNGTQFWLWLPAESSPLRPTKKPVSDPPSVTVFWAASLAASYPVRLLHGPPRDSETDQMFSRLMDAFQKTQGKEAVFAVDLSTFNELWINHSAQHLVSALFAFTYIAPITRRAAVIFNVPKRHWEVIRSVCASECEHLRDDLPKLSQLCLGTAIFCDDDEGVMFFSPSEETRLVLNTFESAYPNDQSVDDILQGVSGDFTAEQVESILRDHAHLFAGRVTEHGELRFFPRLSHQELGTAAQEALRTDISNLRSLNARVGPVDPASVPARSVCAFVHQLKEGEGLFRLPSGCFSRTFFQVGILASSLEWRSRIGAAFAGIVAELVKSLRIQKVILLTVTRSTPLLVATTLEFLNSRRRIPKVDSYVARDMEELVDQLETKPLCGSVIVVTDVVCTGHQVSHIVGILRKKSVDVLSVLSVVDIRTPGDCANDPVDVPVHALHQESIDKILPGGLKALSQELVIDIDNVEVCPVGRCPQVFVPQEERMWLLGANQFLQYAGDHEVDALVLGHVAAGGYHHYLYYVDGLRLLDGHLPVEKYISIRAFLSRHLLERIGETSPDDLVLLHPDPEESRCRELVAVIEDATHARWRHTVYRNRTAGAWRFSAFVEHGVPLRGKTVIVVDDGTCTGDTLLALAEIAALGGAKRILGYFLIDRMPLAKSDAIFRLRSLYAGTGNGATDIRLYALGPLPIPVYGEHTCPMCRYREALAKLASRLPAISSMVRPLIEGLQVHFINQLQVSDDKPAEALPWALPIKQARVWLFRQSLACYPYDPQGEIQGQDRTWRQVLDEVITAEGDDAQQDLLALAFIACSEPDAFDIPWSRTHGKALVKRWLRLIESPWPGCGVKVKPTLAEAVFELSTNTSIWSGREELPEMLAQSCVESGDPGTLERLVVCITRSFADGGEDRPSDVGGRWLRVLCRELDGNPQPRAVRCLTVLRQAALAAGRVSCHDVWCDASAQFPEVLSSLIEKLEHPTHRQRIHRALSEIMRGLRSSRSELRTVVNSREGRLSMLADFLEGFFVVVSHIDEAAGQCEDCMPLSRTEVDAIKIVVFQYHEVVLRLACGASESCWGELFEADWLKKVQDITRQLDSIWDLVRGYCEGLKSSPVALAASVRDECANYRVPVIPHLEQPNRVVFFPQQLLRRFLEGALRNVEKHGFPGRRPGDDDVWIEIGSKDHLPGRLAVSVFDRGDPPDPDTVGLGVDMQKINRAASLFGGEVLGLRVADDGTKVCSLLLAEPKLLEKSGGRNDC